MEWIEYKSKKILYANWAGFKGEKGIQAITELGKEYTKHSKNSILVILDVSNTVSNENAVKKLSELSKNSPARAVAIVGFNTIKRLIASRIRKDAYFAKDLLDAKEWLIMQ